MKCLPRWTGIRTSSHRAFTLIEMMVSTTILMLLIAITAQVINSVTISIASNRNRMNADGIARMVFDRMAMDFEAMIKRKDVDYVCKGMSADTLMAGNDSLFFYGEAPAYFSGTANNSPIALVGYRVASNTSYYPHTPVMERLSKGLLRDGGGNTPGSMVYLSYASTSSTTPLMQSTLLGNWADVIADNSTDAAYHVIANQVFRMEVCYLLKPYTKPDGTTVAAKYSIVPYNGVDSAHSAVNGFQDVSAIVVAIAVLDDTSRNKIADVGAGVSAMAAKLADAAETDFSGTQPNLMASKWSTMVKSSDFAPDGTPKVVADQVRVYQRHFYLNNLASN